MLFWLTFIQALPLVTASEVVPKHLTTEEQLPSNAQPNLIAQTLPPVSVQPTLAQVDVGVGVFAGTAAVIVVLLLLSIWAYTRVYVITPNNEAFVRTGGVFVKKNP